MNVLRSFYCPVNKKMFQRGAAYSCPDKAHITCLQKAGIIEVLAEDKPSRKRKTDKEQGDDNAGNGEKITSHQPE
ncbi:hypothetical protein PA598K_01501 [Paenibacillus sp. 598K]|uniref:hypothetical protein n=1 Tax=Paenibacillus sp. 598K TaxID=1117987 RepID=UPI000FF96885|nr:hypothetical protein [Paenibacillus sp. 598K]GBF73216.1 hypothetical protein PA598K_01501 [Paenibacillus sp. 598K]